MATIYRQTLNPTLKEPEPLKNPYRSLNEILKGTLAGPLKEPLQKPSRSLKSTRMGTLEAP